jgi:hypothetical protein
MDSLPYPPRKSVSQGVYMLMMIKLWNYNKSRTHSTRGVRRVRIALDDQVRARPPRHP